MFLLPGALAALFLFPSLCVGFYSVSETVGSLSSSDALFADLFASVSLAEVGNASSVCYASAEAIAAAVATIPQWDLQGNTTVHRQYLFSDFRACWRFMSIAATVADKNNHHPLWTNVYNRVDVYMSTDDVPCLATFDIETAAAFDKIFALVTTAPAGNSQTALSPGAIAGIAIGSVSAVCALVVAFILWRGSSHALTPSIKTSGAHSYGALSSSSSECYV